MLEAILSTLTTIGWLGAILGILIVANTASGTITNVFKGEKFSWKKMGLGLLKSVLFFVCAGLVSVAFTMLPFINDMITEAFGITILSADILNSLSAVAVLGVVVSSITVQAKKAILGITDLANLGVGSEEITLEAIEDKEGK